MPQPVHALAAAPADSAAADTLAIDSNALQVAPQYLSGFPDTVQCDTAVASMTALPVIEVPPGTPAEPLTTGPLHDTGCMALLLAGVMAVVVSYRSGYKYLESFLHNMFSTRRRENLFEDHTMNETRVLTALMANTCIVEGLLFFLALDTFVPSLSPALHAHVALHVCLLTAVAAVFYVGQLAVYTLIANVFSDAINARLWKAGFNATQSLLGLLLLPLLALALIVAQATKEMLICATFLYICARIVFICKGFRIFYSNLPSLVYFILYLCAVEIVPVVVLGAGTVFLCQQLQSFLGG